jgi:hypothetical protein
VEWGCLYHQQCPCFRASKFCQGCSTLRHRPLHQHHHHRRLEQAPQCQYYLYRCLVLILYLHITLSLCLSHEHESTITQAQPHTTKALTHTADALSHTHTHTHFWRRHYSLDQNDHKYANDCLDMGEVGITNPHVHLFTLSAVLTVTTSLHSFPHSLSLLYSLQSLPSFTLSGLPTVITSLHSFTYLLPLLYSQ